MEIIGPYLKQMADKKIIDILDFPKEGMVRVVYLDNLFMIKSFSPRCLISSHYKSFRLNCANPWRKIE